MIRKKTVPCPDETERSTINYHPDDEMSKKMGIDMNKGDHSRKSLVSVSWPKWGTGRAKKYWLAKT